MEPPEAELLDFLRSRWFDVRRRRQDRPFGAVGVWNTADQLLDTCSGGGT